MTFYCPGCVFHVLLEQYLLAIAKVYAAVRLWADMQQAIAGIMTCYVQL